MGKTKDGTFFAVHTTPLQNSSAVFFLFIFLKSLELQKVPAIWKHANIVPITKCKTPKIVNDFRPVALTSLVMKVLEKITKWAVLQQVRKSIDPLHSLLTGLGEG